MLVYTTVAVQSITKTALRQFRANILDKDDVFRSEFYANLIFYGGKKHEIEIEPEALSELAAWNVKTQSFVASLPAVRIAPGPYVLTGGKTWQYMMTSTRAS